MWKSVPLLEKLIIPFMFTQSLNVVKKCLKMIVLSISIKACSLLLEILKATFSIFGVKDKKSFKRNQTSYLIVASIGNDSPVVQCFCKALLSDPFCFF